MHILPLVAHSALCLYNIIETGVHIFPLVAHSALCLYIETGVHILPLVAHSALHILPLVARLAPCTGLYSSYSTIYRPFLDCPI